MCLETSMSNILQIPVCSLQLPLLRGKMENEIMCVLRLLTYTIHLNVKSSITTHFPLAALSPAIPFPPLCKDIQWIQSVASVLVLL